MAYFTWFDSKMILRYMEFNFQKLLKLSDVQRGFKKLKKKKKYKDIYNLNLLSRYIESANRDPNKLNKFLNSFKEKKEDKKYSLSKLNNYYLNLKKYQLDPFDAFAIEKGNKTNEYRPLLVPTPKDRLLFDSLHFIVFETLKPFLLERRLLGLGLTKNQKVSDIVLDVYNSYVKNGYSYVLILDYGSFFSLIDRSILLQKMRQDDINENLVSAIKYIINNKINNGATVQKKTGVPILGNGIPQGLSFSPLLASYYILDIDDIYIKNKKVVGFRYIDDIIILGKSEKSLINVYSQIENKSKILKMKLHPIGGKSQQKNLQKEHFTYLGVNVSSGGIRISEEKFSEFLEIIKTEIFSVKARKENSAQVDKIKKVYYRFVRGWLNHYEQIVDDPATLHNKLDNILKSYFLKSKIRKSFYKKHSWILISNNTDLIKK